MAGAAGRPGGSPGRHRRSPRRPRRGSAGPRRGRLPVRGGGRRPSPAGHRPVGDRAARAVRRRRRRRPVRVDGRARCPPRRSATVVRLVDGSPFMAVGRPAGHGRDRGALRHSGRLGGRPRPAARRPDVPAGGGCSSPAASICSTARPCRLLTVGAVLGKEFDLDLAVALTGQGASQVTPALDEARRRRILWVDEDGQPLLLHPRQAPRDAARPARRRRAPKPAPPGGGARSRRRDPDRVFELAYHFDAAGEPDRALPYALRAAELARGRHALDVGAQPLPHRRTGRRPARRRRTAAARIAEGLGDVLTLAGRLRRSHASSRGRCPSAPTPSDGRCSTASWATSPSRPATRPWPAGTSNGRLRDLGGRVPRPGIGMAVAAGQGGGRPGPPHAAARAVPGPPAQSTPAPSGSSWPSGSTAGWPTSTGSAPARSPAPGPTCGR